MYKLFYKWKQNKIKVKLFLYQLQVLLTQVC